MQATEVWSTTEDVANHIAKPVSWVYANAVLLGIPRSKIGNQYRYRLSEVDAWLADQRESEVASWLKG